MASGYVLCPCCGYDTVADDDTVPELCSECEEAGCDASGEEPCLCEEDPDAKHWGYGSGMPGCLFDSGPNFAETQDAAIDGVLWLFSETGNETDLSAEELAEARADLKSSGTHYFSDERARELGASLVSVWECDGPCPQDDDC